MKKLLLMLSAAALTSVAANAQTRLVLYEEFTGENCGPCASTNPGADAIVTAAGNKIIKIQYQSPIPSAGPIYNQYKTITDARSIYYSVPFAPYGRLDGTIQPGGSPGHVAYLTAASINTEQAIASPFNMTVSYAWSPAGDSVTATVNITAVSAYAPSGANLKLRIGILEHMQFATPPGTNGETDFPNVVREMVPDANGTQLPNAWTASMNQSFTVKGKVPTIVDKNNTECRLVAWIQNDADKSVAQAAVSTHVGVPTDISSTKIAPASPIACSATSATVTSTATLKNTGTTTLTSAKVYARADNSSTYVTATWTGSLAPGATTTVSVPAVTLTVGTRAIIDSVALPNGANDVNIGNNVQNSQVIVINPATVPLPITQNFEGTGGFPTGWYTFDPAYTGKTWINGSGTGLAHNASNYMPWYKIGTYASGSVGYLITPIPSGSGQRTLEFYQAYAQNTAANNDKLEVVYSTNCGTSWTSVWSAAGSALATTAPTTTYWLPSPSSTTTDWKLRSISLASAPANAMIAFRATAGGGNNLFIDDINLRTGPAGVGNVINSNSISLYPNPARESATLEFTLEKGGVVAVNVLDAVGRTVANVANTAMAQGAQHINIPTANLAAGVYNITIQTEEGSVTQRLSVVK